MPGKNKPKRLDRNNSWRVQRRKKKRRELASGGGRVRKPRPKKSKTAVEEKAIPDVPKKVVKKAVKKTVTPEKAEEILSKVAKNNGKKEE